MTWGCSGGWARRWREHVARAVEEGASLDWTSASEGRWIALDRRKEANVHLRRGWGEHARATLAVAAGRRAEGAARGESSVEEGDCRGWVVSHPRLRSSSWWDRSSPTQLFHVSWARVEAEPLCSLAKVVRFADGEAKEACLECWACARHGAPAGRCTSSPAPSCAFRGLIHVPSIPRPSPYRNIGDGTHDGRRWLRGNGRGSLRWPAPANSGPLRCQTISGEGRLGMEVSLRRGGRVE